ncbi:hypothetical protein CH63R_01284 [Colletotrichum higginsianum IMI 349063]|uniref:Uncharacterized protein n=1 Tax=Colletotrichum higginsianum (strain IMI 349063) TaxID=759273 RepID=A0A1B7YVX7_COLHI|nr:hypothetical protein CH63R_01284 [Colletotrichum higginsianum IMI 349063]OBR16104.1 hypothetical protein CH63R_01284 [Colletotrichum higginsianum IMI 349063]
MNDSGIMFESLSYPFIVTTLPSLGASTTLGLIIQGCPSLHITRLASVVLPVAFCYQVINRYTIRMIHRHLSSPRGKSACFQLLLIPSFQLALTLRPV